MNEIGRYYHEIDLGKQELISYRVFKYESIFFLILGAILDIVFAKVGMDSDTKITIIKTVTPCCAFAFFFFFFEAVQARQKAKALLFGSGPGPATTIPLERSKIVPLEIE